MIDVNDLRKGTTFELDGRLFRVLEYSHNKPGRGNATIRTKVRDIRTGATFEKTFQSGDRVQDIRIENLQMQYLYHDGDLYHFMDTATYDQIALSAKMLADAVNYLMDGMNVIVQDYNGEALGVDLPITVDLKVTQADTVVRGDATRRPASRPFVTRPSLRDDRVAAELVAQRGEHPGTVRFVLA